LPPDAILHGAFVGGILDLDGKLYRMPPEPRQIHGKWVFIPIVE